jgi:hypothetical protein
MTKKQFNTVGKSFNNLLGTRRAYFLVGLMLFISIFLLSLTSAWTSDRFIGGII